MNSAILIIDMQRGLFSGQPYPFEAERVITRINRLTEQARDIGVPVIFTQHSTQGYLNFGSDDWQLLSELVRCEGDVMIHKTTADPFLSTDLYERLKQLAVTELVICGYASEICVDTTVRRASGLGYRVRLVADAHTTHDKPHLPAEKIREHHNITLSMSPMISIPTHDKVEFN